MSLSGIAGASAAAPTAAQNQCGDQSLANGVAEHHATGKVSLWHWATAHRMYMNAIVRDTVQCGPGWTQLRQVNYFDTRAGWAAVMPKGMIFYSDWSADY